MRLFLTIAALSLALSTLNFVAFGQQTTCSCDRACHITCDDGCSAFCGSLKTCLVSCGSNLIYVRVTLKLSNKKGQEIASALSDQTRTKIEFTPYPRNTQIRYDLEIRDDDIWNVLTFLDRFGNVKVGGVNFSTLRKLHTEMRMKKQLSQARFGTGSYIRVLKPSKRRNHSRLAKNNRLTLS
jgi:hypothetical protein